MTMLANRRAYPLSLFPRLNLGTDIEKLFDSFFDRDFTPGTNQIDIDFVEKSDSYELRADLPGVKEDDVQVALENDVLSISCSRKEEQDESDDNYHVHERRFGSVSRSIRLPVAADPDSIQASLSNGVLTIQLTKTEQNKRRQIEVKKA